MPSELYDQQWTDALVMAGSERRAPVLVRALQATPDPEGKQALLRDWFSVCEAIGAERIPLRREFERAGFTTDAPDEVPDFPVMIYRAAWEDDDPETALSWTTDLAFAERFCKGLLSIRAMFLGYYRVDVDAFIWAGICKKPLAFFNGRGESEVIPARVLEVQAIAKLEKAGR